jgi:hypothetical protein
MCTVTIIDLPFARPPARTPVFELLDREITRTPTQKVYDGTYFTVPNSPVKMMVRSMRGEPVVEMEDGSLQMLVEGCYLEVPVPGYSHPRTFWVSNVRHGSKSPEVPGGDDVFYALRRAACESCVRRYVDDVKAATAWLVENLAALEPRIFANVCSLPMAAKILAICWDKQLALLECDATLSKFGRYYKTLMDQVGYTGFSGADAEAYFLASSVLAYYDAKLALTRAEQMLGDVVALAEERGVALERGPGLSDRLAACGLGDGGPGV